MKINDMIIITNQATNQHTDQTLTIYQQTPSISLRVSNEGEENLKIKGKMRDFLQGLSFSLWSDSGTPKLLIPLANLVDLQLRGSGTSLGSVGQPRAHDLSQSQESEEDMGEREGETHTEGTGD